MKHHILISAALSLSAGICLCGISPAQPDFGRATRETDRAMSNATTRGITSTIQRQKPRKVSITIDENAVSRPGAADEQKFFVSQIEFIGLQSFTPYDLSYITKKYINRELASKDLNALTKAIEMEYLKRGMVSVVFVPPQEIEDERLKIQVIEKSAE